MARIKNQIPMNPVYKKRTDEEELMEMINHEYDIWFQNEPMPPHADSFIRIALESFGRIAYITGYHSAAKTIAEKLGI